MTDQDVKFEIERAIRQAKETGFSEAISVDWLLGQLIGPVAAEQMKILREAVLKSGLPRYVHLNVNGKVLCGGSGPTMEAASNLDLDNRPEEYCPNCRRILAGMSVP